MFSTPLIAAPMAGGTTTPALVHTARRAGAYGFVAGGYLTAQRLADQIAAVRRDGEDFGVNLFVPRPEPLSPADAAALARYRTELEAAAGLLGSTVPARPPAATDPAALDYWDEKVELLLADPVPVVSFTFGLPPVRLVQQLHARDTRIVASVTTVAEARAAADLGVDALVVQHPHAGGHSAAFLPPGPNAETGTDTIAELVARVRAAVDLPLVGAGGIGDAATAKRVLAAGAQAVQVGTALLRTDESGARPLHKDALADPQYTRTVVTRAFTGRPARALENDFARAHSATAPAAYPEVHFLTGPLRAAAAAVGNPQALNLWAGTAWRQARPGPAAGIVESFLREL
ncbi:nitronate monooxygenase [Specibacter cremeus]|uniref:nitronate monooxygenase n=1 Tax=Specibacter cremeus TaxID=1629051 RepID=UPI000F7AE3A6|nr:nitronate monooxygenase [Specibacter cremeus]